MAMLLAVIPILGWDISDAIGQTQGQSEEPPQQLKSEGKSSGALAFLRLGAGARAQGMGRAFTALVAGDPSAPFWNPAGLGELKQSFASLSGRFLQDASFDTQFLTGTVALPLGPRKGGLGINLLYYTVGEIQGFNEKAEFQGTFQNAELAAIGSYGLRQGPVSIGVGVRYLSQKFSGPGLTGILAGAAKTNSGVGFDVGMLYQPTRDLSFGMMLRDGSDIGDIDHMLAGFSLGAGYSYRVHKWRSPVPIIRVAMDLEQIKKRPLRMHLGTELALAYTEELTFSLRGGISDIFLENRAPGSPNGGVPGGNSKLTLGFGIKWNNWGLDAAFISEKLDSSSLLSLSFHR